MIHGPNIITAKTMVICPACEGDFPTTGCCCILLSLGMIGSALDWNVDCVTCFALRTVPCSVHARCWLVFRRCTIVLSLVDRWMDESPNVTSTSLQTELANMIECAWIASPVLHYCGHVTRAAGIQIAVYCALDSCCEI
jgi:hypothetical protein